MTCPHCRENLRRRERVGRRCVRCGREFALDPQTAPFRLNDLHLREVARRLSHNGLLRFTTAQLYHAVQPPAPAVLPAPYTPPPPPPRSSVVKDLLGAVAALAVAGLAVLGFVYGTRWLDGLGFLGAGTLAALLGY